VAKLESLEASGGTGSNRWYTVTLSEGRNREVRRLFAAVGLTVSRLIRIAYGDLRLPPQLRQGRAEELPPDQVDRLVASLPSGASKTRAALF
jgi:23S rRNA pseudouridine2605 synthase